MAAKTQRHPVGELIVAVIECTMSPELKKEIAKAADREDPPIPMNEFMVKATAEKLGCPQLAKIPRKRPGRPRKQPA